MISEMEMTIKTKTTIPRYLLITIMVILLSVALAFGD